MIFLSVINAFVHAIAALLIFVVGYFALLLCVIAGLVIANLIHKGARLSSSHKIPRAVSTNGIWTKVGGNAHMAPCKVNILLAPRLEGSRCVATVRRSSL